MSSPITDPPPRRNLWPYGIVIAFAIFITGTASLIVLTSFHGQELVTADYYEQELQYQRQLDSQARTGALQGQVSAVYDATARCIRIAVPPEHAAGNPSGSIQLYRPAAAGEDRRIPLAVDPSGRQQIDAGELSPGLWRVRLGWKHGGEDFVFEAKLVLGGSPR